MADLDQMNVQMDVSALVREEIITDRKIGTIRVLTPVTVDGTRDFARDVVYMGETQIMTQMGPLPISFQIKAATLEEAVKGYQAIITPIDIAGERLGTLFIYKKDKVYEIDDIILSEYGTTVVGLEISMPVSQRRQAKFKCLNNLDKAHDN